MTDARRSQLVAVAALATALAPPTPAGAMTVAEVYRASAPAVVVIQGSDGRGHGSSGSGTIVSASGLIVTNDHVIRGTARTRPYPRLAVYLKPDHVTGEPARDLLSPRRVEVLARDPELDLALLRLVDPPAGLTPIAIGDSERVEVGESVAAIGHPGGGGLWTLTTGTVSSVRRDGARDVFQTDAAINPGNSGGPLLDQDARLIGVNTFVRRVNDKGLPLEGLAYSLRSARVLAWIAAHGVTLPAVRRGDAAPGALPASDGPPRDGGPAASGSATTPDPADPTPDVAPARDAAPTPRAGSQPSPPATPPAVDAPESFDGPDGESMFGIRNRRFDLDSALRDVYKRTRESAEQGFDELDALGDDGDPSRSPDS